MRAKEGISISSLESIMSASRRYDIYSLIEENGVRKPHTLCVQTNSWFVQMLIVDWHRIKSDQKKCNIRIIERFGLEETLKIV